MKNVDFVVQRFPPYKGGVENHIKGLLSGWSDSSYSFRVITESEYVDKVSITRERLNNINCIVWRLPKVSLRSLEVRSFKQYIVNIYYFIRFLKDSRNIVHFQDYLLFYKYLLFISLLPRFKKIHVTFHGWEGYFPPRKRHIFLRRLIGFYSKNTLSIGSYISKWYGTPLIYESYGFVEHDNIAIKTADNIGFTNKIKILYLGRLASDAGVFTYFRLVSELHRRNLNIEFDVVGDGVLFDELREMCRNLGIDKIVTFHGWSDNPQQFIKRSNVVFSSGYLVMLESWANKKLVVSTYENALKFDYLNSIPLENKYFIMSDDFHSLADKLLDVLSSRTFYNELIDKTYNFARSQTLGNLASIYKNMWR